MSLRCVVSWLFMAWYIKGIILPSYVEIRVNHYKNNQYNGKSQRVLITGTHFGCDFRHFWLTSDFSSTQWPNHQLCEHDASSVGRRPNRFCKWRRQWQKVFEVPRTAVTPLLLQAGHPVPQISFASDQIFVSSVKNHLFRHTVQWTIYLLQQRKSLPFLFEDYVRSSKRAVTIP